MPGEHKLLLATEVGALLGPAAAAAAGLEFTAEDADKAVGEGGSSGKRLEEGGAAGMNSKEEKKSTQGDMRKTGLTMHDMKFRDATSLYGGGKSWTNKKVNYCFHPEAKPAVRQVVARSVEYLKKVMPCIGWKGMHTHSLAHSRVAPCPHAVHAPSREGWPPHQLPGLRLNLRCCLVECS
jgi:hypothetical protein